jgi:hypothetical protein
VTDAVFRVCATPPTRERTAKRHWALCGGHRERDGRPARENGRNAIGLSGSADRIKIVPDSPHAQKARFYLRELRPDLAGRLVPAKDYRSGELVLIKPVLAAADLRNSRAAERRRQLHGAAQRNSFDPGSLGPPSGGTRCGARLTLPAQTRLTGETLIFLKPETDFRPIRSILDKSSRVTLGGASFCSR